MVTVSCPTRTQPRKRMRVFFDFSHAQTLRLLPYYFQAMGFRNRLHGRYAVIFDCLRSYGSVVVASSFRGYSCFRLSSSLPPFLALSSIHIIHTLSSDPTDIRPHESAEKLSANGHSKSECSHTQFLTNPAIKLYHLNPGTITLT